jgi:hypothetical protein
MKFYGQLLQELYTAVWEKQTDYSRYRLLNKYKEKVPHRSAEAESLWNRAIEFGKLPENNPFTKLTYSNNPFLSLIKKDQALTGATFPIPDLFGK